mmetsp:Transcript_18028/g.23549  ORF Transcript_18028/g.23549 Transcript_18028/m.23549 type:complete len:880 (-) Transcript_18028:208-2847(-)
MDPDDKKFLSSKAYVGGELIGKGSFGKVYRCTSVNGALKAYAVKIVKLQKVLKDPLEINPADNDSSNAPLKPSSDERIQKLLREIDVMKELKHPCIVQFHQVFRTTTSFYLIMELVLGLDLYEVIVARNGFKTHEAEAAHIFGQICSAIGYIHNKGIVHRDIKPENIIIQAASDSAENRFHDTRAKLIDFGLSKVIEDIVLSDETDQSEAISLKGSEARSLVGTPRYVAPEILAETLKSRMKVSPSKSERLGSKKKPYGKAVDCYSMGVLLHVMLGACFPQFDNTNTVVFRDSRIAGISAEAKDLIIKLLRFNPEKRLSMSDSLDHPWISRNRTNSLDTVLATTTSAAVRNARPNATNDSDSKILSFEDFQQRVLDKMDGMTSSGNLSDVSVESMEVSEPVLRALNEHNDYGSKITGLKRQASSSPPQSKSSGTGIQATIMDQSGSLSSIENIDIPDSKNGMWATLNAAGSKSSSDAINEILKKAVPSPKGYTFDQSNEYELPVNRFGDENVKDDDAQLVRKNRTETKTISSRHVNSEEVVHFGSLEDPDLLLGLQAEISNCLKVAFDYFGNDNKVAPGIIASSVGSRELMRSTQTLIKKLEQTSGSVTGLLPDIQVAVEEGEFGMANAFFQTIKEWIQTLKDEAQALLQTNVRVIATVNNTMLLARERCRENRNELNIQKQQKEKEMFDHLAAGGADADSLLDSINAAISKGEKLDLHQVTLLLKSSAAKEKTESLNSNGSSEVANDLRNLAVVAMQKQKSLDSIKLHQSESENELIILSRALTNLQKVDKLLQQHASFWSHMEVVIQVLMQRANHVESMTNFTKNPRLRGRFMQRLSEYSETWINVQRMCERFNVRARSITHLLFNFLQDDLVKDFS